MKTKAIIFIIVVAGAIGAIYNFGFLKTQSNTKDSLSFLSDPELTDTEVKNEILLYAKKFPEKIHELLPKVYKQEPRNSRLEEAYLMALGYSKSSESLEILLRATEEEDHNIKKRAIEALGSRTEPESLDRLLTITFNGFETAIADELNFYRIISLMKVDLENKDEHIQTLIKLFETVSDTRKVVLFAEVLQKNPEDAQVLAFARKMAYKGQGDQIIVMSIRHLSSLKDKWISKHYKRFLGYPALTVRAAVVESLHFTCPDNRFELIEMAKKYDDPVITEKAIKEEESFKQHCK